MLKAGDIVRIKRLSSSRCILAHDSYFKKLHGIIVRVELDGFDDDGNNDGAAYVVWNKRSDPESIEYDFIYFDEAELIEESDEL